jgi:acetate kinase
MIMSILTLNCGSSSVKYSVYDPARRLALARGVVERVGAEGSFLKERRGEREIRLEAPAPDHVAAVRLVLRSLGEGPDAPAREPGSIRAVGHRAVHGGERFARSALVTDELERTLEELAVLAPLHNPPNLAGIRAARAVLPEVPQVAVFDTAFHQSMPRAAYLYPLPMDWYRQHGIRRYGFHGTSHLYVSRRAAVMLGRPLGELKLVTLHIGNGASAAAVQGGLSVDTSMGFTPLEGLVMGTRSGSIDPAIPLYLMGREGLSSAQMDQALNKYSGLQGLTGRFSDRRDIEAAAAQGDLDCQLALEIECRTLAKTVGSYAAAMGGLHAVVFTAGVGENSALIRARAMAPLAFLGIELDEDKNRAARGGRAELDISRAGGRVRVLVIPTDEELVIAEDTLAIIEGRFDRPDFRYSFA